VNIDTLDQRAREMDVHLARVEITPFVEEKIAVKRPQASALHLVAALRLKVAREIVNTGGDMSWAAALDEGENERVSEHSEAADVRREVRR
jgi:hypothetical protein